MLAAALSIESALTVTTYFDLIKNNPAPFHQSLLQRLRISVNSRVLLKLIGESNTFTFPRLTESDIAEFSVSKRAIEWSNLPKADLEYFTDQLKQLESQYNTSCIDERARNIGYLSLFRGIYQRVTGVTSSGFEVEFSNVATNVEEYVLEKKMQSILSQALISAR